MSDKQDDFWNEAEGVTCPDCQAPYEMVRPGKIQPTCLCEAFRVECANRQEAERCRELAERRVRELEKDSKEDLRISRAIEDERDRLRVDLKVLNEQLIVLQARYDDLLAASVAKARLDPIVSPGGFQQPFGPPLVCGGCGQPFTMNGPYCMPCPCNLGSPE